MTQRQFHTIGLMGRSGVPGVPDTLAALLRYLTAKRCDVLLESNTAQLLSPTTVPVHDAATLAQKIDLLIVVGGDGSLLSAAHIAVDHDLPVLGINRGRLGFLTDIHPQQLDQLDAILEGEYVKERRCLLHITHQRTRQTLHEALALNDAVLLPGDVAQMIEFDVYVDQQFVCHHRADGMIVATPTGSTAYALSGGGPILYPSLGAMVLVPMFPHTLSSRPIVISDQSQVVLQISERNETHPYLSCDGLNRLATQAGDQIHIRRHEKALHLIHPLSYNYFHTLREKLHWEKQASRIEL